MRSPNYCASILALVPYYRPGYKSGGPIASVEALVGQLRGYFSWVIATADRDYGDTKRYPNIPDDGRLEQDGLIWRRAVENLIPRLFWPGKPVLNDSDITRAYTGIMVAGANEGTSIGIGYMAESYVDFGPVGMFVPILLLGVLWGAIYAYFLSRPHPAAVNCAFAAVALMDTVGYESSATKIVAGLVLRLLFLGLLLRFVMPKVEVWPTGRRRAAPVSLAVWARERGGPQAG
jgi:hypothetical protein